MKHFLSLALLAASCYAHGATTIGFDDLASGTPLVSQYQSLGVAISGGTVINSLATIWPAHSTTNVVFADSGFMTFDLNPSVTGNVKTVSAYISGDPATTVSAYDASNTLVGQGTLPPSSPNNTLVSVTSSGNPIVHVEIQGGASNYAIDDFTFATAVNVCADTTTTLGYRIATLPYSLFRKPALAPTQIAELKAEVVELTQLLVNPVANKTLITRLLAKMSLQLSIALKPSPTLKDLLDKLCFLASTVYKEKCPV